MGVCCASDDYLRGDAMKMWWDIAKLIFYLVWAVFVGWTVYSLTHSYVLAFAVFGVLLDIERIERAVTR